MGVLVMMVCCLLAISASAAPRADFYVAKNGNDAWSGTLSAPNRQRTDGPFATLQRAQQAVRELRQKGNLNRPVVVMVRRGVYSLDEPLLFTPEDSGTAQSPTIYTAYPGEKPILSGGVILTGWQVNERGHWEVNLPQVASGEWNFIQLWVNGERRYRPRLPKEGYFTIAEAIQPPEGKPGWDRFRFHEGDLRPDWYSLQDVEILAIQIWSMARLRIAQVDTANRVVTFTGTTSHREWWSALNQGNRYLVENVREALQLPGEWYLDRRTGTLTYIPMPGETPEKAVVVAPKLPRLIELRGDVQGKRWVQHLIFRGLTFAHTNWVTPPQGYSCWQAEVLVGGAISAQGARDCVFEDCRVTHVGDYAFDFGQGCKRNRVERCEMTDMGAGGIKIGTMNIPQDEEQVVSHHVVRDNLIAHGGRLHAASVGVWIGQSPHNRVEHNEICDFYSVGVSVGWTWGYTQHLGHHNTIAYNHIHDLGQGVLSDLGGIYTLGLQEGSLIHHNLIHDIGSFSYGGWGIYFDEGTTHLLAENNVVYRTKTGGFHQHYGKENRVVNNVFAYAREGQLQRTRQEPHLSFTFERNIVIWKEGPLLHGNWGDDQYKLDYNLYWHEGGGEVRFANWSFEEWKARGQDEHSLVADPLFVNPEKGDFRLKPGSPALKLGFKPIDLSRTGRLTNRRKGGTPLAHPAFPISR